MTNRARDGHRTAEARDGRRTTGVETADALELAALPGVTVRFDGLPGGPQRVTSDDHGFLRLPLARMQRGVAPITATLEDFHRTAPPVTTTVQAFDASKQLGIGLRGSHGQRPACARVGRAIARNRLPSPEHAH